MAINYEPTVGLQGSASCAELDIETSRKKTKPKLKLKPNRSQNRYNNRSTKKTNYQKPVLEPQLSNCQLRYFCTCYRFALRPGRAPVPLPVPPSGQLILTPLIKWQAPGVVTIIKSPQLAVPRVEDTHVGLRAQNGYSLQSPISNRASWTARALPSFRAIQLKRK